MLNFCFSSAVFATFSNLSSASLNYFVPDSRRKIVCLIYIVSFNSSLMLTSKTILADVLLMISYFINYSDIKCMSCLSATISLTLVIGDISRRPAQELTTKLTRLSVLSMSYVSYFVSKYSINA